MASRNCVPVWLMSLTNISYGLYGGAVAFAVPQILGIQGVAEPAIAGLVAVAYSPGFWSFLFSPVLDVRFSRRWYAVVLAAFAAVTIVLAFLNLDHLGLLTALLTAGFFASYLYQSALGGWLSTITTEDEKKTVSVWLTIGNVGGFGLLASTCNQMVARFSPLTVALILGAAVMLPTALFPFMPAPGPDRRLAKESFGQFFGDLLKLVKRREVLVAIAMFVAPAGTFSLTNFLGSRGADFHASPGFVGAVGGVGVALGGIVGCLLFPPLSKLMKVRPLYLAIGLVGACVTLGLMLLPLVENSFAVVLIAENLFQSLAITASMAVIFEVIGKDNPLASTTFCFISSAYGVPISYMIYVDSAGYTRGGGIRGSLAFDAVAGIVASLALGAMLVWLGRRDQLPINNGAR